MQDRVHRTSVRHGGVGDSESWYEVSEMRVRFGPNVYQQSDSPEADRGASKRCSCSLERELIWADEAIGV